MSPNNAERIINDDVIVSWKLIDATTKIAEYDPEKALLAYDRRRRWEIHYGITIVADRTNNQRLKNDKEYLERLYAKY
jgi:hypothetical protein